MEVSFYFLIYQKSKKNEMMKMHLNIVGNIQYKYASFDVKK